jgi:preprotein translocase subunit SecE
MGKVKVDNPSGGTTGSSTRPSTKVKKPNPILPFLLNFLRADVVKPTQGKTIRWLTAGGLALLLGAGVLQFYNIVLIDQPVPIPYVVGGILLALAGWFVFRMVQYGPFVDFLIATEAEMKKVSWTSKEDLYKATIVVLVTVAILATYLFLVDKLWVFLLELLGVLKFRSTGFGANAG